MGYIVDCINTLYTLLLEQIDRMALLFTENSYQYICTCNLLATG